MLLLSSYSDFVQKLNGGLKNMKKYILPILALGLGAGSLQSVVAAEEKPMGLSVRVGAAFPTSRSLSDKDADADAPRIGSVGFAAGIEYELKLFDEKKEDTTGGISISVDGYGGNRFSNFPVLVNYTGRTDQFIYSAGLGYGSGRVKFDDPVGSSTRNRFAYQASVGYEFSKGPNPMFVEARWYGSAERRLNAIAAMVGIRF